MFFKHTWVGLLWAILILILCGMPGNDIPHNSFLDLIHFDKIVHALLFAVLSFLFIRGFALQISSGFLNNNAISSAFLLCIIYGAIIELLQYKVFKQRSADAIDFIANTIGCIIGTLAYKKYNSYLIRKTSRTIRKN